MSLFFIQLTALLRTRLILLKRNLNSSLVLIIFPIYYVALSIIISTFTSPFSGIEKQPVSLSPKVDNTLQLAYSLQNHFPESTWNEIKSNTTSSFLLNENVSPSFTNFGSLDVYAQEFKSFLKNRKSKYDNNFPVGGYSFNSTPMQLNENFYYSTTLFRSSKATDNFLYSVLLKNLNSAMFNVATKNTTLASTSFLQINPSISLFAERSTFDISAFLIPLLFCFGITFFLPILTQKAVQELEEGFTQQLFIMGCKKEVYYLAFYFADIILMLVPLTINHIILFGVGAKVFTQTSVFAFTLPLLFFGFSAVALSYLLSFLIPVGVKATLVSPILGFVNTLIIGVPAVLLQFVFKEVTYTSSLIIHALVPHLGIVNVMMNVGTSFSMGTPITIQDVFDIKKIIFPTLIIFLLQTLFYFYITMKLSEMRWSQKNQDSRLITRFLKLFKNHPVKSQDEEATTNLTDVVGDQGVKKEMQDLSQETNNDEYILKIKGFTKSFPIKEAKEDKIVLDNLWLGVKNNECLGFLGPNGAGKTTCMKILIGLENANSGSATIGGMSTSPYDPKIKEIVGFCPQSDVLFPELTPLEHLKLYNGIRGITDEKEVDERIKIYCLEENINVKVKDLSGGNKRKLSIAIATVGSPKLIFLDEPTTGIDIAARRSIWDAINKLKLKSSLILTSHSMEEVEYLSDRIGILVNGKLRCLGTSNKLKSLYGNGFLIKVKLNSVTEIEVVSKEIIDTLNLNFKDFGYHCTIQNIFGISCSFSLKQLDEPKFFTTKKDKIDIDKDKKLLNSTTSSSPPSSAVIISNIFETFEKLSLKLGNIDYTVTQTDLGQ
ncbi:hypothetical protein HK099_008098, partial [Clydaea vesicula]